ncbi:MAG: GNAT family N-acetyltransferase [Chloroflexi bacterium]|nr:GNAT family N-acetyltransferase [Chloroflexota bacterium]
MNQTITLPIPEKFQQFTWRPAQLEDAAAIQKLSIAAMAVDGLDAPQPIAEIEQVFHMLEDKAIENTILAMDDDGNVIAMGLVFAMPPGVDERQVRMSGSVHVDYRGQGIGTFLLKWMEVRARQELQGVDDGLSQKIIMVSRDHLTDRIALFEQQGFQPIRYFYKMARDLTKPIPDKPLLSELRLISWTPDLDEATRGASNNAFRDHFGFISITPEFWQKLVSGSTSFCGDMTYLVMNDEDNVVGYLLTNVDAERNATREKTEADMDQIGVIRGWRKMGIASALIVVAMQAYKEAGIDLAVLGVDTENPSGALRLYENLGFVSTKRSILFEKVID